MKKRIIWWVLVVAWCALIFFESSNRGPESGNQSQFVLEFLNSLVSKLFGEGKIIISELFIRKAAHFTEYFILGCLLFKALYSTGRIFRTLLFSLLIGVPYATSDEMHQYFIPGRAARLFDVSIDSLGLLAGTALIALISWRIAAGSLHRQMADSDNA